MDHAVDGYRLVLPPGWDRIPLREGTDEAIRRIVRSAFPDGGGRVVHRGDEMAAVKMRVHGRLRELAAHARDDAAGIDLYLPVRVRGGVPVPASFVVSELRFPPGATVVRERREYETGDVRRVDYVLPSPGGDGRTLTAAFATPAPDPGLAGLLVELFDAVMGTLQWQPARRGPVGSR